MANTNDVFEKGMETVIDDIDLLVGAAEEAKQQEEDNFFWKGLAIFGIFGLAVGSVCYAVGNANGYKEGLKDQFNPNKK